MADKLEKALKYTIIVLALVLGIFAILGFSLLIDTLANNNMEVEASDLQQMVKEKKAEQFTTTVFFDGEFTPLKLWKNEETGVWYAYTYHNETKVVYFVTKQPISNELTIIPLLNEDGTAYTYEQYIEIHGDEDN